MSLVHAILASLDVQPMTGYDLKKFFDISVSHFWTTTQSHIYKALDDLEKDGWITRELVVQEGKPNRNVYRLTERGCTELRRWLTTPLPPAPVREAWLIQLFFSHTSTDEEIIALIEARGQMIRNFLETYRIQTQTAAPADLPPGMERAQALWRMTLDYGIAFYEFELEWNRHILERVRKLPHQSSSSHHM